MRAAARLAVLSTLLALAVSTGMLPAAHAQAHPELADLPAIATEGMEARVATSIQNARRQLAGNPASALAWAELGMVLQAHDLIEAALFCYGQANRRDTRDYRWPYLAAVAAAGVRPTEAAGHFAKAAALEPRDHTLFIAYADLLTRLGRNDPARSAYEHAQTLNLRSSYARIGRARLAILAGDAAGALTLLEQARGLSPRNSEVHTLLAQVHRRLGDPQAAGRAEWMAKAHGRLSPRSGVVDAMRAKAVNAQAYSGRGSRLAARGDLGAAEAAYREVLSIRPGSGEDLANLATVLSKMGRHHDAFELFERGLALDPGSVQLLSQAGHAYVRAGESERAAQSLRLAVDVAPNSAHATNYMK